ncbi:hypothetical protein [Paraburkholderia heleia]|uniref:hypothetical protein n=1 Tax=Paraburkholderia heleia TaxID=634127 RepID=UPI0005AB5862|nr:hypothetical protein [Paraburkholderia heleia]
MSTKEQTWRTKRIREMLAGRGLPAIEPYTTPKLDGPVVAVVTIIPGKSVYDAAAENYDMAAAQARWAVWDRVLADVLEPCDLPVLALEPIMTND